MMRGVKNIANRDRIIAIVVVQNSDLGSDFVTDMSERGSGWTKWILQNRRPVELRESSAGKEQRHDSC